jgi:hypothetical protein
MINMNQLIANYQLETGRRRRAGRHLKCDSSAMSFAMNRGPQRIDAGFKSMASR